MQQAKQAGQAAIQPQNLQLVSLLIQKEPWLRGLRLELILLH